MNHEASLQLGVKEKTDENHTSIKLKAIESELIAPNSHRVRLETTRWVYLIQNTAEKTAWK